MENIIKLRTAAESDIPAIIDLYKGTVRTINALDYTPEQIEVWASGAEYIKRWSTAVKEQYFVIAEIENSTAGFGSITKGGYLDFLYVHKDHQRKGTGSELLYEIERKAAEQKNPEIFSHVSRTAKGLFEKHGYVHKEDINDLYKGVLFINALMVKKLG